ncbi:DUF1080 domain-containing protein [Flavobacteriaceae bacterium]|nr:DUF1080 domain-containing protein [Flavobacteriaceae bacterium]
MRNLILVVIVFMFCACDEPQKKQKKTQDNGWGLINSNSDKIEGWFFHRNKEEYNGWSIENGVMTYDASKNKSGLDSSILTNDQYYNFEISFDWKTAAYANSGFLWGVRDIEGLDQAYLTGREIQIVDPQVYENMPEEQKHNVGALYDMIAPKQNVSRPTNEWNTYFIRINHDENLGVLVFNNTEVLRFPLRGEEWDQLVQESKFKTWSEFGKYEKGHISLQAHGPMDDQYDGVTSFRNIKIRKLD